MNVNHVNLEISAVSPTQYPNKNYPEVAFVGRSNVGKSSLINGLINRKNYAHTSNHPGKTQTLNFYNVEDKLYFVDIPGYGYARVSKKERAKWGDMIETYLLNRPQLKGAIQLIDGRHAPSDDDVQMQEFLAYYGIETLTVATKMDKLKKNQWNKAVSAINKKMNVDNLLLFSARTKYGINDVWKWFEQQTGVR